MFAASGVLAARDRDLDLLGIVVVATITAIGGGTLRDLLLDRHPIFWVADVWYPTVIIVSALATVAYMQVRPPPGPPLIVVLMGTMTGVAGGVLRDVITARVPLLLRREIYATAAIIGIAAYLALHALGTPRTYAFGAGMFVVVALRLIAIRWGLHLPLVGRP